MAFPDTPVTLLARLEERENGAPNQQAWKSFFDLYHGAIRMAVNGAFKRCGWHTIPDDVMEETIADVVVSVFKGKQSYDPKKGKFRNYLRQLAQWRVKDRLAKSVTAAERLIRDSEELPDGHTTPEIPGATLSPSSQLAADDLRQYRDALLVTLLEDVRHRVSPRVFAMFELCKLQEKSPEEVACFFKVKRNVVDNAVYRITTMLKELAAQPEYRKEYFE